MSPSGQLVPFVSGYRMVAADGGVFSFGGLQSFGSMGGRPLNKPVVGMATSDLGGYWLVASDGGIFAFGDAGFFGSTGAMRLNQPIVAMDVDSRTAAGTGWWPPTGASSPSVTPASSARPVHMHLNKPVVGMASTPDGGGYWLVASDGGIFAFGDATFFGSTGAVQLNQPMVGMASSGFPGGYWLVASDGGIFAFGGAKYFGSTGAMHLNKPIVGMDIHSRARTATGWLPPTAASSPSAEPPTPVRWVGSRSMPRSWASTPGKCHGGRARPMTSMAPSKRITTAVGQRASVVSKRSARSVTGGRDHQGVRQPDSAYELVKPLPLGQRLFVDRHDLHDQGIKKPVDTG